MKTNKFRVFDLKYEGGKCSIFSESHMSSNRILKKILFALMSNLYAVFV